MRRETGAVIRFLLALSAGLLLFGSISWAADKDQSDIEKRIQNAANVLDEIMSVKEKAIPDITNKGPCTRDYKLELNASKNTMSFHVRSSSR